MVVIPNVHLTIPVQKKFGVGALIAILVIAPAQSPGPISRRIEVLGSG